jgi:hypothetical protein
MFNNPSTMNPTKLGRWNLHYDPQTVKSKVDQANEDHCGCCHVSTQQMQQMQKRKWQERQQQRNYAQTQNHKLSKSDEYYIPYFM